MTRVRARGEDIRRFILENVEKHPSDISRFAATHFDITRQAVNKHLQKLSRQGCLSEEGNTRSRTYKLQALSQQQMAFTIAPGLAEDVVWRNDISRTLGQMPENVLDIWHYGFTEIFNNAIDHSSGKKITVHIEKTAATTEMMILDDGVGIFNKIQAALGLIDASHAVLELAKGKLTTSPEHHTGQGIFFTSRMFDEFDIMSGGVFFAHQHGVEEDWISPGDGTGKHGTAVWMKLNNHTARTARRIFDQYSSGDDYGFTKTVVPVHLAQYGNEKLISRSQAKRVLTRVEVFKTVVFDFKEVLTIGQAFADEIFRVFPQIHPEIEILQINANSNVKRMIERAKSGTPEDGGQTSMPLPQA